MTNYLKDRPCIYSDDELPELQGERADEQLVEPDEGPPENRIVVCCMLYVLCCVFHVCMFYVACFMCCMFHVARCMFYVLRFPQRGGDRTKRPRPGPRRVTTSFT